MVNGCPYRILNIQKTASQEEIKKAYKTLSRTTHPDKGGDAEEFKKISTAYQTLTDSQKKHLYDSGAVEYDTELGIKDRISASASPFADMFNGPGAFNMGTFFKQHQQQQQQQQRKIQLNYDISIFDLIKETKVHISINKQKVCTKCNETGFEDKLKHLCKKCNGQKVIVQHIQLGPGFSQKIQHPCSTCNASGKDLSFTLCSECKGTTTINYKENIDVTVPSGLPIGFPTIPKSVVIDDVYTVVFNAVPVKVHNTLYKLMVPVTSHGPTVVVTTDINVLQSIAGEPVNIKLLTGEHISLSGLNIPLPSLKYKCIKSQGLCIEGHESIRGDMLIKFECNTTLKITKEQQDKIAEILHLNVKQKSHHDSTKSQKIDIDKLESKELTNDTEQQQQNEEQHTCHQQ
jgi:DnaJ-class molecular chaperone